MALYNRLVIEQNLFTADNNKKYYRELTNAGTKFGRRGIKGKVGEDTFMSVVLSINQFS
jgi:hypothetical protein